MDALASEYGWSIDYVMNVPVDVAAQLGHAILHRKGVKTLRKRFEVETPQNDLASRLSAIWGEVDNDS